MSLLGSSELTNYFSFLAKESPEAVIRLLSSDLSNSDLGKTILSVKAKLVDTAWVKTDSEKIAVLFFNPETTGAIARFSRGTSVKVELFLGSEKVLFDSRCIGIREEHILLAVPEAYSSRATRSQRRHKIPPGTSAFFRFKDFRPERGAIAHAPTFDLFQDITNLVRIVDISLDGAGIEVNFPAFQCWWEAEGFSENIDLILPGQKPIPVALESLWNKRFRQAIKHDVFGSKRSFRSGCRFHLLSDEAAERIALFIGDETAAAAAAARLAAAQEGAGEASPADAESEI